MVGAGVTSLLSSPYDSFIRTTPPVYPGALEVPPADEVRKHRVRLEQSTLRRPLTKHAPCAPFRSALLRLTYLTTHARRKRLTPFRPRS